MLEVRKRSNYTDNIVLCMRAPRSESYPTPKEEVVMRAAGCRDPDSLERRPSPSRTAPTSAQEAYPTL